MLTNKVAGTSIIIASILLIITMGLHPSGGGIEKIISTVPVIIVSHSLAIVSIPILLMGFIQVMRMLGSNNYVSIIAFLSMTIAMGAGIVAAAINGIALPILVLEYKSQTAADLSALRHLLRGYLSLNHAFDYIFLGAIMASTACWCVGFLRSNLIPKIVGFIGLAWIAISLLMLVGGFEILSLGGFRLFIIGQVIWFIFVGMSLMRSSVVGPELHQAS